MGICSGLHPLVFNTMAWLNKLKLKDGTPRMFIARFTFDSISEKRRERASQEKSSKDDETAPEDFFEQVPGL